MEMSRWLPFESEFDLLVFIFDVDAYCYNGLGLLLVKKYESSHDYSLIGTFVSSKFYIINALLDLADSFSSYCIGELLG